MCIEEDKISLLLTSAFSLVLIVAVAFIFDIDKMPSVQNMNIYSVILLVGMSVVLFDGLFYILSSELNLLDKKRGN